MDCHWFRMSICRTRSFIEKITKSKSTKLWGCFITVPFILSWNQRSIKVLYLFLFNSYILITEILWKYTLILIYKCSQIWTNLAGNFLDLQVCETRFRIRIKKSPNPNKRIYISLLTPYLSEQDFSNFPVWNFHFDELDFFPSLNWIFVDYTGSKTPVQTGKKYLFIKLEISNWRIWKIQFR